MRIVSLNIASFRGASGLGFGRAAARRTAPRLAALLAAEAPDVLALQEAPAPVLGFDPVATLLGRTPGVLVVRDAGPRHGPAILTRRSLRIADARLFSEDRVDGKGYALAAVDTPIGSVLVVSIHLAVVHRPSRRRQIDTLADAVSRFDGPKVVVGDLNDGSDGPLYLAERLRLVPHSPGRTFPSAAPALRLDWAFASPELELTRVVALRHFPSDHCGVRIDLGRLGAQPR